MFVAKWSPGITPEKPSLASVPVWLDFVGVPLQFFNRDALKEIAGLVGHPICLHPSTENLTNLEVAKVYTVIDPRKPLPEAVNARFESGEVIRITVSCPWLPSLCSHCSQVGHTISKCPAAPPRCEICRSVKHATSSCTRTNANLDLSRINTDKRKGKAPIKSQLPIVGIGNSDIRRVGNAPKTAPKTASKPKKVPTKEWVPTDSNKQDLPRTSGLPVIAQSSKVPTDTGSTPTFKKNISGSRNDIALGDFMVDLHCGGLGSLAKSPAVSSSDEDDQSSEGLSNEDDDPDDEGDQYIQVISRCSRKKNKGNARVRGPLKL